MKYLHQKQRIQEEEYIFPYHYIPTCEGGNFCPTRSWSWGYQYLSAVQSILERIKKLDFESLLDVGCGDGRFLREVKKTYSNKELLGTDRSERAIPSAKTLNPDIPWVVQDISKEDAEKRISHFIESVYNQKGCIHHWTTGHQMSLRSW